MQEEYNSFVVNNTWSLVPLPKGRKPISSKWVFKIKHGVRGEVERYKARLVARDFTQTFGVDYNETFAPVAKFVSIRCILALAAIEDMEIHQMDVKIAFLNGDLEEEIYMEQPEGFTQEGEHLVCKLHKSLYGLKQSPRAWNQKLDAFLKSIKFVRSDVDFNVYVAQVGDVKFFIVVYINDLILVCDNKDKLLQVKELSRKFEMKVTCISSLAWKWKGIVHNVCFTSTKLDISRRFSNAFVWRIAKPSKCPFIPRQS